MELETVGKLVTYVVLALLAADRGWSHYNPPLKETNGKLAELQEEIAQIHRDHTTGKLDEVLGWVKDNHEDIASLRTENASIHNELVERIRGLIGK